LLLTLAALVGATCVQALGAAAAPTPPEKSVIQQYIEQVPTSHGSIPVVSSRGARAKVSKRVVDRIAKLAGADRALLEAVVSAAEFGAPQRRLRPVLGAREQAASPLTDATGRNGGILPLIAGIALMTAAGAAAAFRRRRRPAA